MFDANAAHIKLGEIFFAEVHESDHQIKSMGISVGDIVLCSHISNLDDRPRFNHQTKIWTNFNSEPSIYTFSYGLDDNAWLIYSGRPNGAGFICDDWKAKAKEFLGGHWIICDSD